MSDDLTADPAYIIHRFREDTKYIKKLDEEIAALKVVIASKARSIGEFPSDSQQIELETLRAQLKDMQGYLLRMHGVTRE